MKINFLPFLFLIVTVTSCTKDHQEQPYSKLNVPVTGTVRNISIIDNGDWLICGGDDDKGFILKSIDNGSTWTTSPAAFDNPINCMFFLDSLTGFAADEDIIIYKTTNGGINWNPFYDTSWPLTVNRNLRDIWFTNDSTGFVCGGKNLGNGVMYQTNSRGDNWEFSEFNHEYRGICFADELHGVMCGYGSLLLTKNGGQTFEITDYNKSYFTGICIDDLNQLWVCDFNGIVMKSSDKGSTFSHSRDGTSWSVNGIQLNCIDASPTGRIAAAGPNGFLTWSNDRGESWNDRTSFGGNDILKIKWISNNEIVAVGIKGGVYVVKL